jgi:hypothetical protein
MANIAEELLTHRDRLLAPGSVRCQRYRGHREAAFFRLNIKVDG